MNRFVQLVVILCAEPLGNHHTGTDRQTVAQTHQHIDDITGASHGGQSLFADVLSNDHGVNGII